MGDGGEVRVGQSGALRPRATGLMTLFWRHSPLSRQRGEVPKIEVMTGKNVQGGRVRFEATRFNFCDVQKIDVL